MKYVEPQTFVRYHEVCSGGLAFFLALSDAGYLDKVEVFLADIDLDLMNVYEAIRTNPVAFDKALRKVYREAYQIGPRRFYDLEKDIYNAASPGERDPASVLWLRFAVYSSIWRHNTKGELNIIGRPDIELVNMPLPELAHLKRIAQYLKGANLLHRDIAVYDSGDIEVGEGDLMFVDVPYHGTFTSYHAQGFDEEDQIQAIQQCARWSQNGAQIIYTQNDTPEVREWLDAYWTDAIIEVVHSPRTVNSDVTARGRVPELIVSTHHPIEAPLAVGQGGPS